MINGVAHGPLPATTVCQLTMRHFKDGQELYIEPWRAQGVSGDQGPGGRSRARSTASSRRAVTSRFRPGSAPDGNTILVPKENADRAMDAAACIGCGACVAACPNASAALFTGAKIAHLGLLPQGQPERHSARCAWWRSSMQEAFRKLHQHRRVRGGVSEGDQAGSDRADEPRLSTGQLQTA